MLIEILQPITSALGTEGVLEQAPNMKTVSLLDYVLNCEHLVTLAIRPLHHPLHMVKRTLRTLLSKKVQILYIYNILYNIIFKIIRALMF